MLSNIVVGIDGSPSGRRALEWAMAAAADEVHAVHAVSPAMELVAAGFQIDTRPLIERLTAQLEGAWTAGAPCGASKLFTHLAEDAPVPALLSSALACGADAIAVGERGQSPSSRMVGATTGRLAHLSDVPIVIVPSSATVGEDDAPDVTIVGVTGDPSDDAELVAWASRAARDSYVRLELVHGAGKLPDPARRASTSRLEGWLASQPTTNPACVLAVAADPITALVEASRHASLVVVGSHRSSRLAAYLTGALANHLPTVSPCPVAIVPLSATRP